MEEKVKLYRQFLTDYVTNAPQYSSPDDLIFKLDYYTLTEDDVTGECLAVCEQELANRDWSPELVRAVSRAVEVKVRALDLRPMMCAPIAEDEVVDEESSSDTVKITSDSPPPHPRALRMERFTYEVLGLLRGVCQSWGEEWPGELTPMTDSPLTSAHGIRNTRRKMEDRHVTVPHLEHYAPHSTTARPVHFYGVYDGHGGMEAAIYAAAHLHINLAHNDLFTSDLPTAIRQSFLQTDAAFVAKSDQEKLRSGCTAVVAVFEEKRVHIAWCGDSQAALVKNGAPVTVMEPHKPEREDERLRIEAAGGCVVWFGVWRVNGTLSVSRAIGDASYKSCVTAEPDLTSVDLEGDEDYIVLACDGLWDTVTSRDLVTRVHQYVVEQGGSRGQVAQCLIDLARDTGSSDNITVLVIFLRDQIAVPNLPPEPKKETEPDDNDDEKQDEPEKDRGQDEGENEGQSKDQSGDQGQGEDKGQGQSEDKGEGQSGDKGQGEGQSGPPGDVKEVSHLKAMTFVPQGHSEVIEPRTAMSALESLLADIKFIDEPEEDIEVSGGDTTDGTAKSIGSSGVEDSKEKSPALSAPVLDVKPVLSSGDSISSVMGIKVTQADSGSKVTVSEGRGSMSQGEMALMSQTATTCVNVRRNKRDRQTQQVIADKTRQENVKVVNNAKVKVASPSKVKVGQAKVANRDKIRNVNRNKVPSGTQRQQSRDKTMVGQQRSLQGHDIVHLLTGAQQKSRPRHGRWTVAVEIDPNIGNVFDERSTMATF